MAQKTISFLGAGNMATAIIRGVYNANPGKYRIIAYDVMPGKVEELAAYSVVPAEAMEEAVAAADFLFLAVKPQNFEEVLEQVRPVFRPETVVVSIAAGIGAEYLKEKLAVDCKVVLAMPNTPLLVGCGATALACVAPATAEEFTEVSSIFASCGIVAELPENKMREVIAINGSSPAFIYLFAKGFFTFAKEQEISDEAAKTLFCQTLRGAAEMIESSGQDIDSLIQAVSSKGGTTVAGLSALEEGNLTGIVSDACVRCTKRAYELSK